MNQAKAMRQTAPSNFLEALGLPPNTTIAVAFDAALQLFAQRPPQQANDERLREALEHARPFFTPEQREFLTKAGYLWPITGFVPQTEAQRRASSRVANELYAKLFDGIPAGNGALLFSLDELLQAALQKLDGVASPRLREVVEEAVAAIEAEKRKLN